MSNNKSKIDKLKALDKGDGVILCLVTIDGVQQKIDVNEIIQLNKDLTAENDTLITDRDKFKKCFSEVNKKCIDYKVENEELQYENASIKSKWWYKLMMWEW